MDAPSSYQGHASRLSSVVTVALLLLQAQIQSSAGFATSSSISNKPGTHHAFERAPPNTRIVTAINSETQTAGFIDAEDGEAVGELPELKGAVAHAECLEFILEDHKPLGCSVEESLANEPDGARYVFVAQITEGGNAQKAGIKVGDVIVQLSGTFDEVMDVAGLGLDKIRSLVSGRSRESPLIVRTARGSDVMERHEMALVELCIIGDDAATADCITSIYKADDDVYSPSDSDMAMCDEDDGTECLLDSMWDSWSDGLPSSANEEKAEEEVKEVKKKVAPWSSRSSGSGTYVRDPKTGEMRNIDE